MSDIQRYTVKHGNFGGISQERDAAGPYVRWDDYQAEVERLTAERDEAASRCEKLRELADQSAHESGVAFRRLAQAQERRAMARKSERARCIRAIQRMPVPIDKVDGARRAIAAIEALEDTP